MKEYNINGNAYRFSNKLTEFQLQMYAHLTAWKWKHLTKDPGYHTHKGKQIPYDIILPDDFKKDMYPVYRPVKRRLLEHMERFPFKLHEFVGHMASSQAACINLFLPLMERPDIAADVLKAVNQDIDSITVDHLDNGFQIEFWDGKGKEKGLLGDHTLVAGTDADFAVAYRARDGKLKLWLIEHKLTEQEFTPCGGASSKGRTDKHSCEPASAVLDDHTLCYYDSGERTRYNYWKIMDRHPEVFDMDAIRDLNECPFKGGMNQLWRNVLLTLAVEESDLPYEEVRFSVVRHPDNDALLPSMQAFEELLRDKDRFSYFTSADIIQAVDGIGAPELREWVKWYRGLYRV